MSTPTRRMAEWARRGTVGGIFHRPSSRVFGYETLPNRLRQVADLLRTYVLDLLDLRDGQRTLKHVPSRRSSRPLFSLNLPSLVGKRRRGHMLFAARELAASRRLGAKALLGALGEGGIAVEYITADPTAHPHWEIALLGGQRVCFDTEPTHDFDQLVHMVAAEAPVELVSVANGPTAETMELYFDAAGKPLRVVISSYCLP